MSPDSEGHTLSRRFGIAILVFTVLFAALMGRFFQLQIVQGDELQQRAREAITTTERLPARRGEIRDRNGEVLARNVPKHRLTILPSALRDPEVRSAVLSRIAAVLTLPREEREALEGELVARLDDGRAGQRIELGRELVSATCPRDGAALELLPPEDQARGVLYCQECGITHETLAADAARCPHDRQSLTWDADRHNAVCGRCKASFVSAPVCPNDGSLLAATGHNLGCPTCKRRYSDEVAVIRTSRHELPGIRVETEMMREYPHRFMASHVLGYMNLVTREDQEESPGVYPLNARVGRIGVERAFEDVLRGVAGEAAYVSGGDGGLSRDFRAAEDGATVWLTIDARLQREVRQAMRYQRSGAAVAVDPRTGEILAMYSTPGFDPNAWSGRLSAAQWEETNQNPYNPLINKAVTPYAPGSVYKIVTALAFLREGLATPEDTIHCPGHYDFGGRRFHCHQRNGHGYMNMAAALKYSCDVYFYRMGERLGMDRMAVWGKRFGFGMATGIEVNERVGRVPTREWHATTPLGFMPGHTLSTSIGQGALLGSPLQVARSYIPILNDGSLLTTRLVSKVERADGTVERFLPVEEWRIEGTPEEYALIRDALVRVVNEPGGTGPAAALDAVIVAGKTGTAEAAESRPGADPELARWLLEDHAWFAAYAPADDPQIIVVVFLEHGGSGGRRAGPVVRQILQGWLRTGLYRPPRPAARLHGADDPLGLGDGDLEDGG